MGSSFNFMSFGNDPPAGGGDGGTPPGDFPLNRQSSIYSLTFDEFQTTAGGIGKDLGSLNMDELLKSIWNAEENLVIGSSSGGDVRIQEGSSHLQRQGSLTLPRTLSHKTVDEVWRDVSKEYGGGKEVIGGGGFGMLPREPTLGEVTLEEFLVRAGVVREETQLAATLQNVGVFDDRSIPTSSGSEFGFQQTGRDARLMACRTGNQITFESGGLLLNVNGARSASPQPMQPQQLLPKQPAFALGISSNQLGNSGIRGGIVGVSDAAMNNNMVQNMKLHGGGLGVVNLGANEKGSPSVSSDGQVNSNDGTPSLSPVPYMINGGLRGRKRAALEKVVERRQKRMIKNRESAARSRARKQAYTMELEAEIVKLKAENDELRKKQAEMVEMQRNQVLEMMNQEKGGRMLCLRRTLTSPW
ncbi:ABSCISIC ACID-INSENSITIVE 5-like protein 5 [Primulina huaijiensis]|uniref:ABSCISIC ACID-INSENSITIVE 5-like protein 5 n=1 Tax=Primulina huaijiensis TaxID=1492673 RepID=UPI003CC75D59